MHYSANLLRSISATERKGFIESLSELEAATLLYDWRFWARENQLEPTTSWRHWLILAGRGFGKTRTGAEWVRLHAEAGTMRRIALIAPTIHDARTVMVEGESGLLAIAPPWARPTFEPSKKKLTWPNGAQAFLYSAEEPERLRGPQHDGAWCDELCAWRHAMPTWDMLQFGLRLGLGPRTVVTTTPKPHALLKSLMAFEGAHITRGSTYDNLDNLAPTFASEVIRRYDGTRLGRQELMAEILEDVPGALWSRTVLDDGRRVEAPAMARIVVGIDPPVSVGENADECGIIAAGLAAPDSAQKGHSFVLEDASMQGLSPLEWAQRAVKLYHRLEADEIIVEVNQGGALVTNLIAQVDSTVPIRAVHASRGKRTRAEPIAALYERGLVHHVGSFPTLEDQLASYTGEGGKSPDRMDALVWALTHLMLGTRSQPRIRTL
ncbi:DNA-packaging protein [Kordiimonas sp.]|uniref:DNA-packaging protein n=1 Tax=Kordiimonas sp. TaxID=1970157 RepID=UPI003A8E0A38